MKKKQRNPVVITNVYHLAKVGVEGSNPFTRSIPLPNLSKVYSGLRRLFFYILSCIFAGIVTFALICFALEMQFIDTQTENKAQSRHTIEGYSNGKDTYV